MSGKCDILTCERSAHPVVLFCLQDATHEWRHLQLVNSSMCAAFRHYKVQVEEYMAKRCEMLSMECEAAFAQHLLQDRAGFFRDLSPRRIPTDTDTQQLMRLWGVFDKMALDRHYDRFYEGMLSRQNTYPAARLLMDKPDDSWKERYAPDPWIDQTLLARKVLPVILTKEARAIYFLDDIKHEFDCFVRGCRMFDAGPVMQTSVVEVD